MLKLRKAPLLKVQQSSIVYETIDTRNTYFIRFNALLLS